MKTKLPYPERTSLKNGSKKLKFKKYSILTLKVLILLCFSSIVLPGVSQDWLQMGSDIGGNQAYENLGFFVAMSSDGYTVAAGATYHDTEFEDAGAARVFSWNGSAWIQKGDDLTGSAEDDEYGYSIALSDDGNIVAIGAKEDTDDQLKPGYAQIFSWSGSAWEQMGDNLVGNDPYDRFGCNICCSADGSIVAVASRNSPLGEEAGSVRVFEWNGSSWIQKGVEILGGAASEYFGSSSMSLSSDGNILAAGSVWGGPSGTGYVTTFQWNGTAWEQRGSQLYGDNEGDMFGMSASLSADGNTIAIGARNYDGGGLDRGQVKVYSWSDSDWTQKGNDIVGPDDYAFLGWSVCMSADGNSYVVGLPAYSNHEFNNGRVRVYDWDDASWQQKGAEIQGLGENDRCGWAVEMSSDGSKILLGVPSHNGTLSGEGQLRIFEYGTLGIPDHDFGSSLSIFPNPAKNEIFIQVHDGLSIESVSIYNLLGEEVLVLGGSDKVIDIEALSKGIYILKISTLDGSVGDMFIKE
jgi:hypothetical protein